MSQRVCVALAGLTLLALGGPAAGAVNEDPSAGVTIKVQTDHIDFRVGKELVGRYHKGAAVAKPYFWPLNSPHGVPVTRGWPMVPAKKGESTDHPHQKSAWFCHGDVIPEGLDIQEKIKGIEGVDFWSEARGHGKIVCTQARLHQRGDKASNHARVATHNEWRTAGGMKILDEDRIIHLYRIGDARLFVFDIDLQASVVPITFGDTKEGSFGVRVNDAIREKGGQGKLVNADGKAGMKECWGRKSAWCDYSGPIEGQVAGIAIFDHPDNAYPALWHSRDYGLMAANPFGRARSGFPAVKGQTELVRLARGKHLRLRYAIFIHPGDVKDGKVAEHYRRFVKLEWRRKD
jgi:hypothetical protein